MKNSEFNSLKQSLINNGLLSYETDSKNDESENFFVITPDENMANSPFIKKDETKNYIKKRKRLNKSDFDLILESQDSGRIESLDLVKTLKRFINFKETLAQKGALGLFEYLLFKIFPKIYKAKLAKDAMQKLTELDIDAKILSDKTIPYGENEKRYNDLIKYICYANELQVKIKKSS